MDQIIRGGTNRDFLEAATRSFYDDSDVRSKINEKDPLVADYIERGVGLAQENAQSFNEYHDGLSEDQRRDTIRRRARTFEAGLNLSGQALDEYLRTLSQEETQAIRNDEKLLNSLAPDDRQRFLDYAEGRASSTRNANGEPRWDYSNAHPEWRVENPTAQRVEVVGGGGNAVVPNAPTDAAREGETFNVHDIGNPVNDVDDYINHQMGGG
jgi:hypothetical protein